MIIVQIGCFQFIDKYIQEYILDTNNQIFLIDANKECIEKIISLTKDYKNVKTFNFAISKENSIKPFYKTGLGLDNDYVASTNLEHIKKHCNDQSLIIQENVQNVTIDTLMEILNIKKIDILYIDAEGQDLDILKSILYLELDINTIVFEKIHFKEDIQIENLTKVGYSEIINIDSFNAYITKNNLIPCTKEM